jgi:hypothetical protein
MSENLKEHLNQVFQQKTAEQYAQVFEKIRKFIDDSIVVSTNLDQEERSKSHLSALNSVRDLCSSEVSYMLFANSVTRQIEAYESEKARAAEVEKQTAEDVETLKEVNSSSSKKNLNLDQTSESDLSTFSEEEV